MPKIGMEPIRKRQLILATVEAIHEVGFNRTTLHQVARRAGISPGLVAHYFRDKPGLLAATMRHLAEELREELALRLAEAETPDARLQSVLDANFSARSFAPAKVSAWVAFWGQAHGDPQLTRMQRVLRRRLRSNLIAPLRALVGVKDARRIATGLSIFIDGLSLRSALGGEDELDRHAARAMAQDYLDKQLSYGKREQREHHRDAEPA